MPNDSSTDLETTLRERRRTLGLSQQALAERVGVSRQAIVAIEAGRQVPSTRLALQLARGLGCTVESLFALPESAGLRARPVGPVADGERVALGRIGSLWVAHRQLPDGVAADAVVRGRDDAGLALEVLAPLEVLERNLLVAGCAPTLGLLTSRLGRVDPGVRATWIRVGSGRALELLAEGAVHVAGLHLAPHDDPAVHLELVRERFAGRAMKLVHLVRWTQGLVVRHASSVRGVADLARPDVTLVRREAGSGAQRVLDELLRRSGRAPGAGPTGSSHDEVAQLVRWGVADAGVAVEAAGRAEGLDFVPVREERFDLVFPAELEAHPALVRLLDVLVSGAFRAEASTVAGTDLASVGELFEVGA